MAVSLSLLNSPLILVKPPHKVLPFFLIMAVLLSLLNSPLILVKPGHKVLPFFLIMAVLLSLSHSFSAIILTKYSWIIISLFIFKISSNLKLNFSIKLLILLYLPIYKLSVPGTLYLINCIFLLSKLLFINCIIFSSSMSAL